MTAPNLILRSAPNLILRSIVKRCVSKDGRTNSMRHHASRRRLRSLLSMRAVKPAPEAAR